MGNRVRFLAFSEMSSSTIDEDEPPEVVMLFFPYQHAGMTGVDCWKKNKKTVSNDNVLAWFRPMGEQPKFNQKAMSSGAKNFSLTIDFDSLKKRIIGLNIE